MDKNDHLAIGLYSCDRLLHALITAPIPHQSVVEIHKSALRYVREKLQKYYEFRVLLEQMEIYRDMKIGQYPTIPNFIYNHSPLKSCCISRVFGIWRFGHYAISTPFWCGVSLSFMPRPHLTGIA